MKIYLILTLMLILGVSSNTLGQKCKEKFPEVIAATNRGAPKIISKPQPKYTQEARRHQITGNLMLRALFHSSGKVQNVCWVSSLPYGLTENAIKAAYKIVFEPVNRNGHPVSVTALIYYNFDLY